jgi:hypothetical protein
MAALPVNHGHFGVQGVDRFGARLLAETARRPLDRAGTPVAASGGD